MANSTRRKDCEPDFSCHASHAWPLCDSVCKLGFRSAPSQKSSAWLQQARKMKKPDPGRAKVRLKECNGNLELETRSKLHSAEVVGGGSNLPQSAVSRSHIREGKALMIEGIEHFGAHLQEFILADLEFFGERTYPRCEYRPLANWRNAVVHCPEYCRRDRQNNPDSGTLPPVLAASR